MQTSTRRRFIKGALLWLPTVQILVPRAKADVNVVVGRAPAAPAPAQDHSGANTANFNVGNNSSRQQGSGMFTATADRTICRVDLALYKSGNPNMNLYLSLWSNDTTPTPDAPSAIIGSEHATPINAVNIDAADPIAGATWAASWTGLNFSILNTNIYHFVVRTDAQSAANFCLWSCFGADGSGSGNTYNGSVWSNEISRRPGIRIYTA